MEKGFICHTKTKYATLDYYDTESHIVTEI